MDFLSCDGLPTGNISGFYGTRQAAWTQSPEGLASVAKPDILLSWLLPIRCAEVRWAPSGKTQVTGLAGTSRARRLAAPGGSFDTATIRRSDPSRRIASRPSEHCWPIAPRLRDVTCSAMRCALRRVGKRSLDWETGMAYKLP